jgi:hypothetical protein
MRSTPRIFAVDWSGDRRNSHRKIWLAEAFRGELVRLETGRGRDDVAALLMDEAQKDIRLVVGFDFAFSFPLWFCEQLGAKTACDIWRLVTLNGEQWIQLCATPFWGRRGTTCLPKDRQFRRTEENMAHHELGMRPKSVFQIGGAGTVGTGSLRGMPILQRLREAGFSIWPFDPPGRPAVVEIYPRALTGHVNKSSGEERRQYLKQRFPDLAERHIRTAGSCEDAFDAAVSVLVMEKRSDELVNLPQAIDRCDLLEGKIWY